jgi:hypothetical protein
MKAFEFFAEPGVRFDQLPDARTLLLRAYRHARRNAISRARTSSAPFGSATRALERAESDYDREAAGRDFWYTRNGHGVGFWDRGFKGRAGAIAQRLSDSASAFRESDIYRGDDSRVYVS